MKDRIKNIRKELNITQSVFADKIGSTQNVVANYENGRRNPSASVINNICKTFNINEQWLRTGEGEMFIETSFDEEIAKWVESIQMTDGDNFKKRFISMLSRLTEKEWGMVEKKAIELAEGKSEADEAVRNSRTTDRPERTMSREELHAELDRQLDLEEKAEERSSVLADIG